jgi:hypothetical protein
MAGAGGSREEARAGGAGRRRREADIGSFDWGTRCVPEWMRLGSFYNVWRAVWSEISFNVIKAAPVSNEQSLTASNPILGKSGCSGEVTPQQSHNRKSTLLSALCSIEQVQVGLEIFAFPVKEQSTGGFFFNSRDTSSLVFRMVGQPKTLKIKVNSSCINK